MAIEITYTALAPGTVGNLINFDFNQTPSGVTFFLIGPSILDYLKVAASILLGFTSGNLTIGDWADVQTASNASALNTQALASGGSTFRGSVTLPGQFSGGLAGGAAGAFYFGGGVPVPNNPLTFIYPITLPKRFCITHPCCGNVILSGKDSFYVPTRRK